MKHTIASNDVVSQYQYLKEHSEEWEDIFGSEDEPSDEQLWEQAYVDVQSYIEADIENLSERIHNKIVAVGSIQRWNGRREIIPTLLDDADSLGCIIKFCDLKFGGNNEDWTLFDENGRLYAHAYGHDNPTSPHVIEFRMLTDFGSRMWDSEDEDAPTNEEIVEHHSEPIGRMIQQVFGYKYEE